MDDGIRVSAAKDESHHGNHEQRSQDPPKAAFECNICLDSATDPVVTRCGHLFCWPCLHEWLKERGSCPVCQAQASPDSVIPIYGSGDASTHAKNRKPEQAPSPAPERSNAGSRGAETNAPPPPRPTPARPPQYQQQNNDNFFRNAGFNAHPFGHGTFGFGFGGFPFFGVGFNFNMGGGAGGAAPPQGNNGEELNNLLNQPWVILGLILLFQIIFFA